MADVFSGHTSGLDSPAANGAAVTPNDSTDLATVARALWVGTGGAVALVTVGGSDITLSGVPSGTLLPVRAARVKSTGTTASNIVALW